MSSHIIYLEKVRSLSLILLVFWTLGASPQPSAVVERIDQLYQTSQTQAELKTVELLIMDQLKQFPESPELNWRLLRTYYSLGEGAPKAEARNYYSLCIKHAERGIRLGKSPARSHYFKGICAGELGKIEGGWGFVDEMIRDFEIAIDLDPAVEDGGGYRALGRVYSELPPIGLFLVPNRDLDKSIALLKEAVRYGPLYGRNYIFLAESYFKKGEFLLAKETLNAFHEKTRNLQEEPRVKKFFPQSVNLLKKIDQRLGPYDSHAP